jgi:uncharacterized protein
VPLLGRPRLAPGPRAPRWAAALAIAVALLLGVTPARAQRGADSAAAPPAESAIPAPVGFVNDFANVMPEETRAQLEAFLDQVKRKTGVEFAVLTVRTTAPLDPAEYKVKVFDSWHPGAKGQDNGLLLLVAMAERKVWFETGYGLEGTLPDGLEARIIREEITPRFRAGDYAGGVTAAVLRASDVIAKSQGVALEWNGHTLRYSDLPRARRRGPPVWWIALVIFIVISWMIPRRYRGGFIGGGMGGGFMGGFGGGGFGGGGSSFGGFGGGGSGGGGGGGGW